MARFFIGPPYLLAWVISIFIMVSAGFVDPHPRPWPQYPQIAPPSVAVRASYRRGPRANGWPIRSTQGDRTGAKMTGLDGATLYLVCLFLSCRRCQYTLTFETGTDVDIAQVAGAKQLRKPLGVVAEPVAASGHHSAENPLPGS